MSEIAEQSSPTTKDKDIPCTGEPGLSSTNEPAVSCTSEPAVSFTSEPAVSSTNESAVSCTDKPPSACIGEQIATAKPTTQLQMPAEADRTGTVARHYNALQETGLQQRTTSRIFYLRNFNNWVKSMLINDILTEIRCSKRPGSTITVLDLCSGKGGDLLKWKKGRIDRLVCTDIAGTSVEQSESRYKEMLDRGKRERHPQKVFTAEFITADCTKTRLRDVYAARCRQPLQFDLTSCQFSLHYSFESYRQADTMLRNACECLRPGGYFIGTTLDGNELVKRMRGSADGSVGNDVYRVSAKWAPLGEVPLFGAEYNFHLEGVVDCPEFIVYFPVLERMAARYGMRLVYKKPLSDVFEKYISENEGRGLIGRMQALEPYPADESVDLMSSEDGAYAHAESWLKAQAEQATDTHQGPLRKVGTLTVSEWEATTIYLAFAFQKASPSDAAAAVTDASASGVKRRADDDSTAAKLARTV